MSLVLLLSRVGANGIEVEHMLVDQGLPLELVDRDTIVALVTIANDESTLDKLVEALVAAIPATSGPPRSPTVAVSWHVQPVKAMSPRAAFFASQSRSQQTLPSGASPPSSSLPTRQASLCWPPASSSPKAPRRPAGSRGPRRPRRIRADPTLSTIEVVRT